MRRRGDGVDPAEGARLEQIHGANRVARHDRSGTRRWCCCCISLFFGVLFTASATISSSPPTVAVEVVVVVAVVVVGLSSVIFSTRISPGAVTTVMTGTDALSRRVALVLLSPNGSRGTVRGSISPNDVSSC